MKRILIALCALNASFAIVAMDSQKVVISSSKKLHKKFSEANLLEFAQHSRLAQRIGGKECSLTGVEFAIKNAVINYQHTVFTKVGDIRDLEHLERDVKAIVLQ